ncbi:MAG: hypothetical protein AAGG75_09045 [Bacteroidota bacterium]
MTIASWRRFAYILGILGAFQFVALTLLAMYVYPGGTMHNPGWENYSFLYNYFSDLGRTRTFSGADNGLSQGLFKTALTVGGLCLIVFFAALPALFRNKVAKGFILIASVLGLIAGGCYIAIAHLPLNVDYWGHRFYVRTGFIAFLGMLIFYASAILREPGYPRRYAFAFGLFGIILFIQIVIMFFGPRAWRSEDALFLQAVAQKVVVYAEILCMLYQSWGALKVSMNR